MSISLDITKDSTNSFHLVRLTFTDKSIPNLRLLLNRALNCWPDAPAELKELSDKLEYGQPLQDYQSQN